MARWRAFSIEEAFRSIPNTVPMAPTMAPARNETEGEVRHARQADRVQAIAALINPEILSGDEALPFQFSEHGDVMRRAARTEKQAAEPIGPSRLLRRSSERPCDTRAHKRDEFAPPNVVSPYADTLLPCRLAFSCRAQAIACADLLATTQRH